MCVFAGSHPQDCNITVAAVAAVGFRFDVRSAVLVEVVNWVNAGSHRGGGWGEEGGNGGRGGRDTSQTFSTGVARLWCCGGVPQLNTLRDTRCVQ